MWRFRANGIVQGHRMSTRLTVVNSHLNVRLLWRETSRQFGEIVYEIRFISNVQRKNIFVFFKLFILPGEKEISYFYFIFPRKRDI